MKIGQVAPLCESVPPKCYGGTERIVSYLTEELVRQGHEVTLFASGDSTTSAKLVPCSDRALRLHPTIRDPIPYYAMMLEEVRRRAGRFDILHFHIDFLHAPLLPHLPCPSLTTHHGRLDQPEINEFYRLFRDMPLVSISKDQRSYLHHAHWVGTVHHGLPRDLLPFQAQAHGGYLAFLGRIAPEKRPDLAIKIAAKAGMPLKIAAKVDRVDQAYWEEKIRPMVKTHPNVEFIGEVNEREKAQLLGGAAALLFPIDWPEPFGLVMIEAMACGTPVIAFRRGSVPEVVEDGVSGFIVEDVGQAVAAVRRLPDLDRRRVRAAFERRFTVERMARDYLELYRQLIASRSAVMLIEAAVEGNRKTPLGIGRGGVHGMPEGGAGFRRRGPDSQGISDGAGEPLLEDPAYDS
ncbi:Glycosyl transferase [Methylacidimicrobium sp. AP8]|uniref:glycosyltransferase family 4 protein n=1 Tax=Methylacidimicrobium sp. AP8 TaxID=2730359 RepID=UPI0018BFDC2D|nr:glycosyltransferase family 4 protein [Methylacidimicrobium sp. AP8]CAB4243435.1 Glycosyl transferase [Methylacidimicrobium sp. AP8]